MCFILLLLGGLPLFAAQDWTAVTRDVKIDLNLQQYPLLVRTNSAAGSDVKLFLVLYEQGNKIAGGLTIDFLKGEYWIGFCTDSYSNFPTALPAEQDKVWSIFRTDEGLRVECNGVIVLHYDISQCTRDDKIYWERDVREIKFSSEDTASDEYRVGPTVGQFTLVDVNGDETSNWGLLLYNGGTVCDDGWNMHTAVAVCREMGYDVNGAQWTPDTPQDRWTEYWGGFDKSDMEIKLRIASCPDTTWENCELKTTINCGHDEDIILVCDVEFTLVDSNGEETQEPTGLLLYAGGTVCSDGRDFRGYSANLVCQKMGFDGGEMSEKGNTWDITQDRYQRMMSELWCESDFKGASKGFMERCPFNPLSYNCHQLAFLDCTSPECEPGQHFEINHGCVTVSIDGGWGPYSEWTTCSANCGGGNQARNRACDKPEPVNDGADCVGDAEQSRICNDRPCPADCTALDSTWENVVTDPRLPMEHGTAITLGCTGLYTNTGGYKALCDNGQILTDEPPLCTSNCGRGHYLTFGDCGQCDPGTYNDQDPAGSSCHTCPEGMTSTWASTTLDDCTNKGYFSDIAVDDDIYQPWRPIQKDTLVQLVFDSNFEAEDCTLSIIVASINLELDLSRSIAEDLSENNYLLYSLEDEDGTVSFQVTERTTVTISVKERITVELDGHSLSFRNGGRYTEKESRGIEITASSEQCFKLIDADSYVERLVPGVDPERPPTDSTPERPATDPTPEDPSTKLTVELCEQPGFINCEFVTIALDSVLDDLQVRSIKIASIPNDRAIVLVSDIDLRYNVNDQMVDSDLSDGFSQIPGLHLEADGGTSIITIEYVERELEERATDPPPAESGTEHPPPQEFTEPGTVYEDQVIKEDYREVKEVKELVESNVIHFTPVDKPGQKVVKTYKPNFKGKEIPVQIVNEKAEEYKENRTAPNLLGFLTFNGFTNIGITKSKIKKQKEEESAETEQKSLPGLNEDAMIEAVKAFQKFNGFPETGEITEEQLDVLTAPRCGNRDTSYKEEVETFTCVEGEVIRSNQKRKLCELDEDSILNVCAQFPSDYLNITEDIDDFVWDKDYYFEMDVEFEAKGKRVSHIGIAFNYQQDIKKTDYLFVKHEEKNKRLCFSHGTYTRGRRTGNIRERRCVKFTEEQKTLNQFKVRLTVKQKTQTASLAIDGKRVLRFDTTVGTKSSVILFTLGGKNYKNHRVKVFASRICRRNADHGTVGGERSKRYALSNFKWYPNGKAITYSFVNHSSSLGEQGTRQEIIRAIELLSTHGFQFKELPPGQASSAELVFMFMREGRHADGMMFLGAGAEKAHAYVPVHGEIHFNDYQRFTAHSTDPEDHDVGLFYVALHEIGHAMGIKHSSLKDAVMNQGYDNDKAFEVNELDEDDIDALIQQYGDITSLSSQTPGPGNLAYESVAGIKSSYLARLPVPKACLTSIDAAFHYYARKGSDGGSDKIYLISHGYLWMYEASSFAMLSGYPKRTAEVFYGAVGEIDAAFDTGKYICLIIKDKVLIYETYYTTFVYLRTETLKSLFGISEQKVKSAFNNYKGSCSSNRAVCCETTLVISPDKHYKVTWIKKGRQVTRTLAGDGISIVGESVPDRQFQAAFEYSRPANGANEVMQFDSGRVCRSRVHYPGNNYKAKTGWADIPALFQIKGWCLAS